jgi:hypothetical protein
MSSIGDEVHHLPSVRIRTEETIVHPGEYRASIHPGDECHNRIVIGWTSSPTSRLNVELKFAHVDLSYVFISESVE